MTRKEINDGNRLIAQWMGYEYLPLNNVAGVKPGWWHTQTPPSIHKLVTRPEKLAGGFYLGRSVNHLPYHDSWNALMPVVMKVLNHHGTLHISEDMVTLHKEPFWGSTLAKKRYIETIWQLVVDFINEDTTGKI